MAVLLAAQPWLTMISQAMCRPRIKHSG